MSDVKRYSGQMMLGDTSIPAGFMRGMVKGADYDALLAELEGERENAKEWLTEHYALQAERDQLRAELEAIRGQEPVGHQFQDREGEWHNFTNQRHYEATVKDGTWPIRAIYALPPQQPDAWPTLDKPAKVGPVRFHAGLSAHLVVGAAQRQHKYSQQPEVEEARLERFQSAMREFHGEQPDAVSVPRELLESHLNQIGEYGWWADSVDQLRALLNAE